MEGTYEPVIYDDADTDRFETVSLGRAFAAFSLPSRQSSNDKLLLAIANTADPGTPDPQGRYWVRKVGGFGTGRSSALMVAPGKTGLPHGSFSKLALIHLTGLANEQGRIVQSIPARDVIERLKGCSRTAAGSGNYTRPLKAAMEQLMDATFAYLPPEPDRIAVDHRKLQECHIARSNFAQAWVNACITGMPLPTSKPHHGCFVFKLVEGIRDGKLILTKEAHAILTGEQLDEWETGTPVNLRLNAVQALGGNMTALDLYCYANYRRYGIHEGMQVSAGIHAMWYQYGGMHPPKAYSAAVKKAIEAVSAVWPACGLSFIAGVHSLSDEGKRAARLVLASGATHAYLRIADIRNMKAIAEAEDRAADAVLEASIPDVDGDWRDPAWHAAWELRMQLGTASEKTRKLASIERRKMEQVARHEAAKARKNKHEAMTLVWNDDFDPFGF